MTTILNPTAAATSEKYSELDQQAAIRAGAHLFKKYPGHSWHVAVEGGLMKIRSMNLSSNYGYVLKMSEMDPSSFEHKVMLAGGEILERFGLAASKLDLHLYQSLPKDLRGAPLKDTS